jgi:hypothetical protein
MAGLILYADKDNFLYLVPKARIDYDRKTRLFFIKSSKGEAAPEVFYDLTCKNPDTYQLKIEKRNYKYTAFVGVQDEKGFEWKEIGNYTVLGKTLYPGIVAFREEKAKEVTTEFESFKINELR